MSNFDIALGYVLANEGTAYVNNPSDKGGPTRYGIALKTLSIWRASKKLPAPTAADVAALPLSEATAIYKSFYWDAMCGDNILDMSVATVLFDCCVLNGVPYASKLIQSILRSYDNQTLIDGKVGPKTLSALNGYVGRKRVLIIDMVRDLQVRYLDIATDNASQRIFLRTWLRRASAYLELCI